MRAPLKTFAGLLDRSVERIAALTADGRDFDDVRVRALADIWDNNTLPLFSAACAPRLVRARRARAGLLWMADLGAARRRLMVDLDPALDAALPLAAPERSVYRDHRGRVSPGIFPLSTSVVADLITDYDLGNADVRQLVVRPGDAGLRVDLMVAVPRRFVRAGAESSRASPPAVLRIAGTDVTDLRFDAADRHGLHLGGGDGGFSATIGRHGILRAAEATVWPDDPWWDESAAGRAADTRTPHERPQQRSMPPVSRLTASETDAARALHEVMLRIRMAGYRPGRADTVPIRQLCRMTANAGSALLAAAAERGSARERAFTALADRWRPIPAGHPRVPIPAGPAALRYLCFHEPHDGDIRHDAVVTVIAAVPDGDPAAAWCLAGEKFAATTHFRFTAAGRGR